MCYGLSCFDREGKVVAHSIVDRIGQPPLPMTPGTMWNGFSLETLADPGVGRRALIDSTTSCTIEHWFERPRHGGKLELVLDSSQPERRDICAARLSISPTIGFSGVAILLTVLLGRSLRRCAGRKLKAEQSVTQLGEICRRQALTSVYVFDRVRRCSSRP